MKREQVVSGSGLQSLAEVVNRRQDPRPSAEFELMYSAQDPSGEILMGRWHGHGSLAYWNGHSRQHLRHAGY